MKTKIWIVSALWLMSGCSSPAGQPVRQEPGTSAAMTANPNPTAETELSQQISREEALAIALDKAGISEQELSSVQVDQDEDQDIPIYDIELETDYGDYDFEIAMGTGQMIGADVEIDEEWVRRQPSTAISDQQARQKIQALIPQAKEEEITLQEESEDQRPRLECRYEDDQITFECEIDRETGIMLDWNLDTHRS